MKPIGAKQLAVASDLSELLYSHPHGWAPLHAIEPFFKSRGFIITRLPRDNRTDGEYHARFEKNGNAIELHANQWDAKSFTPLIKWFAEYNIS